jgi:VanZ family protein
MNKTKMINWLPVLIWMIIIFMFSAQPASDSNQLSVGFTKVLLDTFGKVISLDIEISTINNIVLQLNHIIRKFAHFAVYLILGILVSRALIKEGFKGRVFLISFFICVVYAASDELHQLFVPGRGCQLKDVLIDSTGAMVGIALNSFFKVRKI